MNKKSSRSAFSILLGVLMVFGMSQCRTIENSSNDAQKYKDAKITLERSTCFGTCPGYLLTITGDGKVAYEGRRFVGVLGDQSAEISAADFKMLVDEALKINYFELKDKYDTDITDIPHCETSLTFDGKSKTIYNRAEGPETLSAWEKLIDQTVNVEQWIHPSAEK